jgi:glycosyltransferase involved in cell wall biosynthesis
MSAEPTPKQPRRPQVWLEATHTLANRTRTGVGYYTEELIAGLVAADSDRDYTLVGNVFASAKPQLPPLPPAVRQRLRVRLSRFFPGKVWNQLFKKRLLPPLNQLIPGRPNLVVFFNFVRLPVTRGVKTIVTIHDLAYRRFPDTVQDRNRAYLSAFVPRAVAGASHLIAVSEWTKRDLIEYYDAPADKISVVYPGVDLAHYRPGLPTAELRARLNLPEHYFLFVSTLEPRKNVLGLIAAYRALPDDIKRSHALVLTGGVGWLADEIMAAIVAGDPVGRIMRTSYVPEADLPTLYNGATAFVFPSLYEGFGMPVLEAMACGAPVITADNSSLPEVAKGAAIMVRAEDTQAISLAMAELAKNDGLRADLSVKGVARAQQFTWAHSAQQLKAVIDQVLPQ